MKKNRMMRLASIMLVAVLMTTCTISGTFAKYVTSAESEDYARVAKWGVQVTANGILFEKEYAKDDDTYTVGDNTVVSSDEWKVVAPGTTKQMKEVQLTGTPEVATRVTYDATVDLSGWTIDGTNEYCPIIFTIEGKTYGINADCGIECDVAATSVSQLAEKIDEAIEACKKDYAPNTNLNDKKADFPSVTWEWPFEVGTDEAQIAAHDAKDTALGNRAAAGSAAFIKLDVATTVTQID